MVEEARASIWQQRALSLARFLKEPMDTTTLLREAREQLGWSSQIVSNTLAVAEGKYMHFTHGAWRRFEAVGRMLDEAPDERHSEA